jgi:hypothetical protein
MRLENFGLAAGAAASRRDCSAIADGIIRIYDRGAVGKSDLLESTLGVVLVASGVAHCVFLCGLSVVDTG